MRSMSEIWGERKIILGTSKYGAVQLLPSHACIYAFLSTDETTPLRLRGFGSEILFQTITYCVENAGILARVSSVPL